MRSCELAHREAQDLGHQVGETGLWEKLERAGVQRAWGRGCAGLEARGGEG